MNVDIEAQDDIIPEEIVDFDSILAEAQYKVVGGIPLNIQEAIVLAECQRDIKLDKLVNTHHPLQIQKVISEIKSLEAKIKVLSYEINKQQRQSYINNTKQYNDSCDDIQVKIEKIIDTKYDNKYGRLYLVKWLNSKHTAWLLKRSISNDVIRKYHEQRY